MALHDPFTDTRDFPHGVLIIGKSGFGKSTKLRALEEKRFDEGNNKIIDMLDFGRFESAFTAFPNPHGSMWSLFLRRLKQFAAIDPQSNMIFNYLRKRGWGSRGYPTEVLVPGTVDMPEKLPSIFKPFRLSFTDMDYKEFKILLGENLSEVCETVLTLAWEEKMSNKQYTFPDLVKDIVRIGRDGKIIIDGVETKITDGMRSVSPLIRPLMRIYRSGILADSGDASVLDLDAIMRDTSKITAFSYAYTEDMETAHLIIAYIIRRIHNLRLRNAERYPNLHIYFREVHKVAPVAANFPGQSISRDYLTLMCTEPRDIKAFITMDSQRANKIIKDVRESAHNYCAFRSEWANIEALDKTLNIPDSVKTVIRKGGIGIYASYMDGWDAPTVYIPPRSHIKKYTESFEEVWKKKGKRVLPKGAPLYKTWKLPQPKEGLIKIEKIDRKALEQEHRPTVYKTNAAVAYLRGLGRGATTKEMAEACGLALGEFKRVSRDDFFKEMIETKMEKCRGKGRKRYFPKKNAEQKWRSYKLTADDDAS